MLTKIVKKEEAVYKILDSKGRIFGVGIYNKKGNLLNINGKLPYLTVKKRNKDKIDGRITILNLRKKRKMRIKTSRINNIIINRINYVII